MVFETLDLFLQMTDALLIVCLEFLVLDYQHIYHLVLIMYHSFEGCNIVRAGLVLIQVKEHVCERCDGITVPEGQRVVILGEHPLDGRLRQKVSFLVEQLEDLRHGEPLILFYLAQSLDGVFL